MQITKNIYIDDEALEYIQKIPEPLPVFYEFDDKKMVIDKIGLVNHMIQKFNPFFFEHKMAEMYYWDYKKKYYVCEPAKAVVAHLICNYFPEDKKNMLNSTHFGQIQQLLISKQRMKQLNVQSLSVTNHLNFDDGYYNIETKEFKRHDVNNPCPIFFRACRSFGWLDKPDIPLMETHYEKMLFELFDCKKPLFELFMFYLGLSFCYKPYDDFQMFLFLLGDGLDGKTFLFNRTKEFFPDGDVATTNLEKLQESNSFLTSNLDSKSILLSEEQEKEVFAKSVGFIKMYTGGTTTLEVNKKGIQNYNSFITAKIIISSNHFPKLSDTGFAFMRRMYPIKCIKIYSTNDAYVKLSDLPNTYHKELATVISHALEYYHKYKDVPQGEAYPFNCEEIIELKAKIALQSNSVKEWFYANFEITDKKGHNLPTKLMHEIYVASKTNINTKYAREFANFRKDIEEIVMKENLKHNYKRLRITRTKLNVRYSVDDGLIFIDGVGDKIPDFAMDTNNYDRLVTNSRDFTLCGVKMKYEEEIDDDYKEPDHIPF